MMGLLAPPLAPFGLAALVLVALVVVEAVSLAVGHSLSAGLDHAMPVEALHTDGAHDGAHAVGSPSTWLSWLNAGRVPVLILAMMALAAFSVLGLAVQGLSGAVAGPLPPALAALVALGLSVPVLRACSRGVARVIPRDETYVVAEADFVGRTAEVTLGPLDHGPPGQVRALDRFGNVHALRARAAPEARPMPTGARVLLVDQAAGVFTAIPAPPDPAREAIGQAIGPPA